MRLPFKHIAHLLLGFFMASCADDIENLYAPWPAGFVFNQVNTTAPLRSALTDAGQFCIITFPNGQYLFKGNDGKEVPYTPTATFGYIKPYGYLCGFVVGCPAVLDFSGQTTVAYELACPNCYDNSDITRPLHFSSISTLQCARCGCVYDLNNAGNEQHGKSRALYRYRTVQYYVSTSAMSISN